MPRGYWRQIWRHGGCKCLILNYLSTITGAIRTHILWPRRPALYPIELRPHHLNHNPQCSSPLAFMSNVFIQNHTCRLVNCDFTHVVYAGLICNNYFLEERERLTTGCDLLFFFWLCCRTLIAFFTSAIFKTPVVRPPLAPAVQYA